MGPVETAIRGKLRSGTTLHTASRNAAFLLERIDADGIVLKLAMRWSTPLSWDCLEAIPALLRGRGWVRSGGNHSVDSEPGSLDEHLKGCERRDTTNYVAVVLQKAGVLELDVGPPLTVRLVPRFA